MRIPTIRGVIDRRVLVNFRVAPNVLAKVCPAPFRPQTVQGFGIAGICLIRLKEIRPRGFPAFLGISSENAAHRIAVEWSDGHETKTGVYIPRRDTSSWLNTFAGGRIFPGTHHHATFSVSESEQQYQIQMVSRDGETNLEVCGTVSQQLPEDSVFDSVEHCSKFFEEGSVGYSPANQSNAYDGLELRSFNWSVSPLSVEKVESSFFNDKDRFPPGSITLDNALLMTGIDHEWHSRSSLCC